MHNNPVGEDPRVPLLDDDGDPGQSSQVPKGEAQPPGEVDIYPPASEGGGGGRFWRRRLWQPQARRPLY